jgi:hypothetical protein
MGVKEAANARQEHQRPSPEWVLELTVLQMSLLYQWPVTVACDS